MYTDSQRRTHIYDLQRFLRRIQREQGAVQPLAPDGIFGSETAAAVREFQRRGRLPVTGTADFATWTAIYAAYRALTDLDALPAAVDFFPAGMDAKLKRGDKGPSVFVLQLMLGTATPHFGNALPVPSPANTTPTPKKACAARRACSSCRRPARPTARPGQRSPCSTTASLAARRWRGRWNNAKRTPEGVLFVVISLFCCVCGFGGRVIRCSRAVRRRRISCIISCRRIIRRCRVLCVQDLLHLCRQVIAYVLVGDLVIGFGRLYVRFLHPLGQQIVHRTGYRRGQQALVVLELAVHIQRHALDDVIAVVRLNQTGYLVLGQRLGAVVELGDPYRLR